MVAAGTAEARTVKSRVAGVIQARLGSSRLPGKVLLPLAGRPMVAQIADRLRVARSLDVVVAAIPRGDEALADACRQANLRPILGDERDLINRCLCVFDALGVDAICRVTADEPLIDPDVVNTVVNLWRADPTSAYTSNVCPRSFPDGLDCEVIPRATLEALDRMTRANGWLCAYDAREELTRPIWERPGLVGRTHAVTLEDNRRDSLAHVNWSVNTPADYHGACVVYEMLGPGFRWEQVLQAFGPVSLDEITERPRA